MPTGTFYRAKLSLPNFDFPLKAEAQLSWQNHKCVIAKNCISISKKTMCTYNYKKELYLQMLAICNKTIITHFFYIYIIYCFTSLVFSHFTA